MSTDTKRSEIKTLFVVVIIMLIAFYLGNPDGFWELGAGSSCQAYNTADVKYQMRFVRGCGCLYPAQDKAISGLVETAVNACFDEQMKTCRGWEKIGDIYRGCVALVTGITGEKK